MKVEKVLIQKRKSLINSMFRIVVYLLMFITFILVNLLCIVIDANSKYKLNITFPIILEMFFENVHQFFLIINQVFFINVIQIKIFGLFYLAI